MALVSAAAWAPRVYATPAWADTEAGFYAWLFGSYRGHARNFKWRWDLLFHLPSETAVALVAVARLIYQLNSAPVQSFLGALNAELWAEGRAHAGAWFCDALRWWGWCFERRTRGSRMVWMREVHLHLLENFDEDRLPELVKERVSERLRSVAISRLRSIDVGYRSYDLVLKMVVDSGRQLGRLADIKCTRFALRTICKYCFGGLPVARTRANFQYKKQLEAAGIVGDMRHACLYCFLHREVCVLESEWHFAFFCPLFSNLRSGPIARQRAEYNFGAEFHALTLST